MNKEPRDWTTVRRLKSPFQVSLRLTKDENERLEKAAQERGVSKAGYIKSVVLGQPIRQAARRPSPQSADLRQILGLLGKLGSNANQIARVANASLASGRATGNADEVAEALLAIQSELASLRALLLAALEGAQ